MTDEKKPPKAEIIVMFTPKYERDEGNAKTNALIWGFDYVTHLQSGLYVFSMPKSKETAALKQLNDLNSVAWAAPRDQSLERRCAAVSDAIYALQKLQGVNFSDEQYLGMLSTITTQLQSYLKSKNVEKGKKK